MSSTLNIDDEWANFLSKNYNDDSSDCDKNDLDLNVDGEEFEIELPKPGKNFGLVAPEPTPIYISTKSKIAYLQDPVDLTMFWDIPVIPYSTPSNGVIKKQIKFNSKSAEELNIIQQRLQKEIYYDEQIMTHIDNPNGRIKFKDIRKITVGISKKDIMSYRGKKKQAFYNCFVMIIRIKIDGLFREFHIKVFNTGKLEIPGVQSDEMFETVLKNIISILQPYVSTQLSYKQTSDTVLINSNFNCGFYINRESLYDILKFKYNIQAIYDPCSYPGIQCKFYYNNDLQHDMQNGMQLSGDNVKNMKDKKEKAKANALANINVIEVSFMIFRTGSVLIVGMCEENVLNDIYAFLTQMLKTEFEHICQSIITSSMLKDKKKKVRRKVVMVMTTTEPLTNANLETTSYNHESSSSAIASKKEEDTVLEIPEKKVKRSYNKKKSTL
jgi:TATA-box binding protein (TBP) (component of TFIID and TFIIIB)